ncbi:MAG TPA: hypothetical protein VEB43_03095 [Anaeromyxobacter sp.]|nr:hypothetical protein [Anaeromyxobacter sp.]
MSISFEPAKGEHLLSVRVSSSFRMEDALQLGAAVADAAPGTEVDVDFLQVREYQGPALARLAEVMRSSRAHLALHGLTIHERKLLDYLGAPADPQPDPSPPG